MLEGPDLLVILVIALIIFGPKKLPEIGEAIGHAIREFKKSSRGMKESSEGEIREDIKKLEETRSRSSSSGLATDLLENTSGPLALPERMEEESLNEVGPLASVPLGKGEEGKDEKLGTAKDG